MSFHIKVSLEFYLIKVILFFKIIKQDELPEDG